MEWSRVRRPGTGGETSSTFTGRRALVRLPAIELLHPKPIQCWRTRDAQEISRGSGGMRRGVRRGQYPCVRGLVRVLV